MTAKELRQAVVGHFDRSSCLVITELRLGTGFVHKTRYYSAKPTLTDADAERKIDIWTIEPYPSNGLKRTAFEIKTSKNDFCRELSDPAKRRPAVRFSNEYYFVAPKGLLPPKSIPSDAGLIEVHKSNGKYWLETAVRAPWHDNAPNWSFVAALVRRLVKDMESNQSTNRKDQSNVENQ